MGEVIPHKTDYARRWQRARLVYLKEHPLCTMCRAQGYTVQAKVVDHIVPHKGDPRLFWDRGNWQPLCYTHHNGAKQSQDRTGITVGCDVNGIPLGVEHAWNR